MSQILVNILESFLGTCHNHNEDSGQTDFACPACAEDKGINPGDDGKYKLAVNYKKNGYKCWVCKFENNMYGKVPNLIKRYGNKRILKEYEIIRPSTYNNSASTSLKIDISLPKEFKKISESNYNDNGYGKAYRYLRARGINDNIIKEYNIGFAATGKYGGRVIIPSYDEVGDLTYFIARAWEKWKQPKYLNPDVEKQLFIFNEKVINWDGTIYLVEGVFDHIVVPNSIPLLGKTMYDRLKSALISNAKSDIVILLDDDAKDAAIRIYKDLNSGNLYNRIKLCTPPTDTDPSLIFEREGNQGIINLLRSSEIVPEQKLY